MPQGITLHLHAGRVRAVQGHIPLGQLLLRESECSEETLQKALDMPGFLGQNLLDLGLKARHLRQALRAQAQEALMALRLAPPQSYMMRLSSPLPPPGAGLERGEVMELLLGSQEALPLANVYQLPGAAISLETAEVELLRWINGRRTLQRAMGLTLLS